MNTIKSNSLKLDNFPMVEIKAAVTAIDRSRNLATHTAAKLIKADSRINGRNVEIKTSKGRGVYVGDVAAFVQLERYEKRGEFVGEFVSLQLPS